MDEYRFGSVDLWSKYVITSTEEALPILKMKYPNAECVLVDHLPKGICRNYKSKHEYDNRKEYS